MKKIVSVQLGFFERVTKALNVVTPERCRIYFRSVRRYLQLYNSGVTGPEIPKAMSQMRKHRKHRAGNLLDDEESQRGRNSHKRTRLEKLKSQSWNKVTPKMPCHHHTMPSHTSMNDAILCAEIILSQNQTVYAFSSRSLPMNCLCILSYINKKYSRWPIAL